MQSPPQSNRDLFEELLQLRDAQRASRDSAAWLIKGKDLPWEINRHGKMQWYLHPLLEGSVLRTLIFFKQEVPAGSRSGRQKSQGGTIFYVTEGRGYTTIDGIRHPWEAGDIVNLPLREEGLVYQHFNRDSEKPAVLIGCEPNLVDALGVDKGSGFEQLEVAPEYREKTEQ